MVNKLSSPALASMRSSRAQALNPPPPPPVPAMSRSGQNIEEVRTTFGPNLALSSAGMSKARTLHFGRYSCSTPQCMRLDV